MFQVMFFAQWLSKEVLHNIQPLLAQRKSAREKGKDARESANKRIISNCDARIRGRRRKSRPSGLRKATGV